MKKHNPLSAQKSKSTEEEKIGLYCYIFSVALSPLGPVFHYSLWGLCLIFLAHRFAANRRSITEGIKLSRASSRIVLQCAFLSLWVILSALLSYNGLANYGTNVTVPLEMMLGLLFAVKFLAHEDARRLFIKIFVPVSVLILLGNFLRTAGIVAYFPNHSLKNGNSLGALALVLFPPILGFAFWSMSGRRLMRSVLVAVVTAVLFFSFSSGVWLSASLGGAVFLSYAVHFHKISFKEFCAYGACFLIAIALMVSFSGSLKHQLLNELNQVSAVGDADKFTTLRNHIWKVALYALKERPLCGYGGDSFFNVHENIVRTKSEKLGLTLKISASHPHSTYFYLCYIGGVPALLLWLAAIGLCMKKMLQYARAEKDVFFPWGVTAVMLLVEILTYGTNGDIFQGRRDIAVMVWCFIGIMVVLPEPKIKEEVSLSHAGEVKW